MLLFRVDQVALNEDKMRQMFATPKKARKKARAQAQTQAAPKEQTPAKTPPAKQKAQPSEPIKRAFQNSEGSTAAKPVNLLQVRKKRKISPTPMQPATTPPPTAAHAPETASSTPATSTPPVRAPAANSIQVTSTPPASAPAVCTSSAETAVVVLSGPSSSEPAPADTQPTETQPTDAHTPAAGTFDDPLNI